MAVDDLAPCVARSSTAMVLSFFSHNISISAPEELTQCSLNKHSCMWQVSFWYPFPCKKVYIFGFNMPLISNSLAPGRSECDSKNVIFNLVLPIDTSRSSHDNALRWMPQDLTDDKLTLVQVMAWCHQAASQYLSQCWLSSLSPYGVARPQWVNPERMINSKSTMA